MRDDPLPVFTFLAGFVGLIMWPFLAIFIHELGHALAGKLIGFSPTRLIVGYPDGEGDPLLAFRAFDCSFEWWPLPFGGATLFQEPPTDRLRTFIITIAGPLMDLSVIFGCVLLWDHGVIRIGLFFIILSQSLDILCNLIPRSFLYEGVRVPNDSKIIIQLLAGKRPT